MIYVSLYSLLELMIVLPQSLQGWNTTMCHHVQFVMMYCLRENDEKEVCTCLVQTWYFS